MLDLSDPNAKEELIFKIREKPTNSEYFYNFSLFAMQLNMLSDELKTKLPHTDSRLRPDMRYYEDGDMTNAALWKDKLEVA